MPFDELREEPEKIPQRICPEWVFAPLPVLPRGAHTFLFF